MIHRRLACLVVSAAALAVGAPAATALEPGYTLNISGPSTAIAGAPVVFQATGSNPSDDFFTSWLDVDAIPASVVSTCPDGYLTASQLADTTGGDHVTVAQREDADAARARWRWRSQCRWRRWRRREAGQHEQAAPHPVRQEAGLPGRDLVEQLERLLLLLASERKEEEGRDRAKAQCHEEPARPKGAVQGDGVQRGWLRDGGEQERAGHLKRWRRRWWPRWRLW